MRCANAPVLFYIRYSIYFINKVHKVRCNECVDTGGNVECVNNIYSIYFKLRNVKIIVTFSLIV